LAAAFLRALIVSALASAWISKRSGQAFPQGKEKQMATGQATWYFD
jgi:hypothetical protein